MNHKPQIRIDAGQQVGQQFFGLARIFFRLFVVIMNFGIQVSFGAVADIFAAGLDHRTDKLDAL